MRLLTWCRRLRIPKPARPGRRASDVVDLAGVGCLVGAAWWWQPILGLVAVGLALLLVGWVLDTTSAPEQDGPAEL